MLLYASNGRLEGWVSLDVGGPVELLKWRSASTLEAAPMWVSPTQGVALAAVTDLAGAPGRDVELDRGGGGVWRW